MRCCDLLSIISLVYVLQSFSRSTDYLCNGDEFNSTENRQLQWTSFDKQRFYEVQDRRHPMGTTLPKAL